MEDIEDIQVIHFHHRRIFITEGWNIYAISYEAKKGNIDLC
jgi:hypothetical protein